MFDIIQEQGFVTVQDLAGTFNVTPQTVRRDINTLCAKGLVQRHHGGVGMTFSTENLDYSNRQILYQAEKQRIARMVAENIPSRASLFINIGTTTEEVAKALHGHERLRVITNNLNVATILRGNENIETLVAGGLVRHRDCGIVGESAIDFIGQFKADYGIIGISGIDLDGTLLDYDYREVRAAQAIIENSRKVYLVADHSKFGRNAMVRMGTLEDIDALFTDLMPPQPLTEALERANVQLFVAQPPA
ncbi:DeoR family transcriptional regulator [Oceanidesulfovibrio indonesiensis]|uniref:DeoR family transcriptional regulator n=1 Tax=Oceanidesulfovibrio indonesiensis TaxID=54767 RepID=A0A7M3MIN1_9BACT|nr:DeoR family transcriptional regulator [Oceanidesulfovibrio indonesiensis]TVM19533.1 DeoR family transcriptional regulator [Oceanidesulfovibrio indonesiensis]